MNAINQELLEACKEAHHILYWDSTKEETERAFNMLEQAIVNATKGRKHESR